MSFANCAITPNSSQVLNSAAALPPSTRKLLAIKAIARTETITKLARDVKTSRKFIYAQKQKVEVALEEVFSESRKDEQVLFPLLVTKPWLQQLVLSLVLTCHSSYQGVIEIFRDLFDCSISKGQVHNIVRSALDRADQINRDQDLSKVRVGAHDEIFQAGSPVLVGCDAVSTYCYLLSEETHRDANTWGVHLLDLRERQALRPDHSVADGGMGLRKGQCEAWPDIPCHGDVFHALQPLLKLTVYLDNRALDALRERDAVTRKLARPRRLAERGKHLRLQKKQLAAEQELQKAIKLTDDVHTLYQWLREDILSLVGPSFEERKSLFDFVVASLHAREPLHTHRIKPVRAFLENHRDNLLAFAEQIDKALVNLSAEFEVDAGHIRSLYELQGIPSASQARWEKDAYSRKVLGSKFYPIEVELKQILKDTIRASSVVENLNGRLRNYFTLRRTLGKEYLAILQFFLNHRRFMRSERPERIGKSPRELMTGESHSHWLELLGFQLFKQAA